MRDLNFARYDDNIAVLAKERDAEWKERELDKALERVSPAKPVDELTKNAAMVERQRSRVCPSNYLHGSDAAGDNFAKELYCGAEWCPICGGRDSAVHKRRFASWLPKARQVKNLGLMVIEWPLASRNKVRSRRELEAAGKIAVAVLNGNYELKKRRSAGMVRNGEAAELKVKYFSRGMRRWHYFGDVDAELEQLHLKFETIGGDPPADLPAAAVKSNVHLNVLLDSGYIPKSWLKHVVYNLREALNEPKLIVHYGYTKEPGRMVHMLKYTTRATFKDIAWDEWLAGQLYGFRNMRSWGVWRDEPVWSLDDLPADAKKEVEGVNYAAVESLGRSICYKDGLPITWSKPRPISELYNMPLKVELGAGYYELPSVKPPEVRLSEGLLMYARRLSVLAAADRQREREIEQFNLETAYYGDILLQKEAELEAELKRVDELGEQLTLNEPPLSPAQHKTHRGGWASWLK